MKEDNGTALIGALWFFSAVVLAALFISAAVQGALTLGHILLTFVILGLAVTGTVYLFSVATDVGFVEKRKRDVTDRLLENMSDAELMELKRRLSDVEVSDSPLTEYISDDGELVARY